MPLKTTLEVIRGDNVTRYNGNNPQGGRQSRQPVRESKAVKITAWRKAKANKAYQEKAYARRYLDA